MKFLKQFSAVLLLGLSLCVAADRGPVAPFQANEKIAFFGDSITHGGIYLYELQLFEALRHPYAPVRILNSGISGGSAWSGLQRIDFDLLERNPDRVFVMFGMNDVGRGNYLPGTPDEKTLAARSRSLDSYRRNLAAVVDRLAARATTRSAVRALDAVARAADDLAHNVSPQLTLEVMLLSVKEALTWHPSSR